MQVEEGKTKKKASLLADLLCDLLLEFSSVRPDNLSLDAVLFPGSLYFLSSGAHVPH
jgi:hypothetical protein